MEFTVLGRMGIRRDGQEIPLGGTLQRALLGTLLSRANAVVSSAVLTEAMWGDRSGDRAGANLHVHVHRLRRLLDEPSRLRSEPGGYRLTVLAGELDAQRFESLIDDGAEVAPTDPARAAERTRAALRLWRGQPFDGVDTPWLTGERHRLTELRMAAIEQLYTADLAAGRHGAAIAELTEQVRRHPLHERLHGLLMIALYRGGRQSRALGVYRSVRQVLIDELGQEPGPELRHIEQRILNGQPIEPELLRQRGVLPEQLPHDAVGFTGREAELSMLDELTAGDPPARLAMISGTGGVGKTALVVHWAHRVRDRFPGGQLYVDLRGQGPEEPLSSHDALAGFLRELGVDSAAIPTEPAERAARFRTLVANRRMLLVLDNARSAEQVRPLLPGGRAGLVLVTGRESLAGLVVREGAHRVEVGRLSAKDALTLLGTLVGARVDAEVNSATELVERCARLPLALRIAAELVHTRPTIEELVAELGDERHVLDLLDAGGDAVTGLRGVFSWSYRQLSGEAARAFRLFSLHPGHDIDRAAFAALTGNDTATTNRAVHALLRAHLLHQSAHAGRLGAHDLLRAYAVDLCQSVDTPTERAQARTRLFDHYTRTADQASGIVHERIGAPVESGASGQSAFTEAEHAGDWLDAERANLVAVAESGRTSGRARTALELTRALHRYLSVNGHHDHALAIYQAAFEAARELGDLVGEGDARRSLGSVYRRTGDLDAAFEHMYRAYTCYREAGHEPYTQLQLNQLAITCTWLGRYPEAEGYLRRSVELADGLGTRGRLGRAAALTYLGQLDVYRGQSEQALRHTGEALTIAEGRRERLDADAIAGLAYQQHGQYEQARHHLERAHALISELGAQVLHAYICPLALVYWRLGRRADAYDYAERCLAIALRTNEQILEAGVRNTFGELYQLDAAQAEAVMQHRAAADIAAAIGIPYERARAQAGLGDTLHSLGDTVVAASHWRAALELYQDLGSAHTDQLRTKLQRAQLPFVM